MSNFKIMLGMEMDKNALSNITKELQNLNKSVGNIKIGIDEQAMNKLLSSIDKVSSSLAKIGRQGGNLGENISKGFDKANTSGRTFEGIIKGIMKEYQTGASDATTFINQMSKALLDANGKAKGSMSNLFNKGELDGFLSLINNVKSRVSEIKPIGDLINTKSVSVIKNDMGELVRVTNTYKDSMGQVQTITSLVNKTTGDLVATQQAITTNEGKRVSTIEAQRQAIVKMQEAYKSMSQYATVGNHASSTDNAQVDMLNNIKKLIGEIDSANQKGLIVDKNKVTAINDQITAVKGLQQAKEKEIKTSQMAQDKQLADVTKLQNTLAKANSQYSVGVNKDSSKAMEEQIQAFSRLDPMAEGYAKKLITLRSSLSEYVMKTREASASAKEQASSLNNLANVQASLDKVQSKYGSFVDAKSASGIQESINKLQEMSKTGVDVKAKVQEVTREIAKLGEQSKKSADLSSYKTNMGAKLDGLEQQFKANLLPTQAITEARKQLSSLSATEGDLVKKTQQMDGVYKGLQNTLKATSGTARGVGTSFRSMLQMATGIYGISSAFMYGRQAIASLVSESTALSDAMISLSRVTNETDDTYRQFADNAFKVANRIGGSAKELVASTTEFAKLGFDFQEAGQLAESASKYATTGWLEMGEATDALSASYTVFSGTLDEAIGKVVDATTIIDLYNATGNKMAIDSKGVGEAMKASANSLSSANNSLSESVALIATANKTVQNSSKIGNALRTISMRLRGLNEETGELIPKMQEIIQAGTNGKVDIMNGDEFKSTYDIMLEVSEVWDELTDKQRAYLGEQIAGKNRVTTNCPSYTVMCA